MVAWIPPSVLVMPATLTKSEVATVSPLSPNTLRILVLVEASNRSFRLSFKVALWVQQGVSVKNMQRGFVINGETADDLVGMSISSAGDVNGDGSAFSFSDACRLDKV
jgi:hypothetical protein